MPGETPDGEDDATDAMRDVDPTFELLRAAQDAEARALEELLLASLGDDHGDVDGAATAIDSAIAQHRVLHEELDSLRGGWDSDGE